MAISMTGFGRGEYKDERYSFLIECKTINHKYIDVNIKLPRNLSYLEEKIRIFAKEYIKRGRVDIFVKYDIIGNQDLNLSYDEGLASRYVDILYKIKDKFSLKDDVNLMSIVKFPDVITVEEKEEDEDIIWEKLQIALNKAFCKLIDMKSVEGSKLEYDILIRCNLLSDYIKRLERYADSVVQEYREKLNSRISEILVDPSIIDENRVSQEVAIYADKSNITEEIVRFNSHIDQLKTNIKKDDSIGRKLDFIIQEMNREANTMGAKSTNINITNLVVDIKCELEKIREQIQNIE